MDKISWSDFEKVDIRAGTIVRAEAFPEAKKPAYKLWVDFGPLGIKQSSAQITAQYDLHDLVGSQIIAVVNFEPKRIAGFDSEVLITGFEQVPDEVILARPDKAVPNGAKLF